MLAKLLISLVSTALCVLLTEGLLRVYYRANLDYQIEMVRYAATMKRAASPDLSHEHEPGTRARLMGVDVSINAHGFRDGEYPREKPAGVFRLMLLGDSMTFGWGAEAECRFGNLVEGKLNAAAAVRGAAVRVEVINTGVGNYNTSQQLHFFRTRGRAFEPDLVVLAYFINDAEPTPTEGMHPVFSYSYLAAWLWGRLDNIQRAYLTRQTYEHYYAGLYAPDQPGWSAARQALRDLASVSRDEGTPLVLALLPELHAVGPEYGFADIHEKVIGAGREAGIELIVDLAPHFADEQDPASLWVNPDDAHPNCRAHEVLADGLYEFLNTHDLVRVP
jgi:lysophospholipase L1-like esterase